MSAHVASSVPARARVCPRASAVSTRRASATGTRARFETGSSRADSCRSLSARDGGRQARLASRAARQPRHDLTPVRRRRPRRRHALRQRSPRRRLRKLKIGIVGFGNPGQFLARRFIQNEHTVIATSRGDYDAAAKKMGARYYRDPDDFCEQHPGVVIFATSILSTEATINSFPVQRLRRNTLVADVLSVKQFPKQLFLQRLPDDFDILCLHPMFGPDSGKGTWKALPLVYDKVPSGRRAIAAGPGSITCWASSRTGMRMVEMSGARARQASGSSQFITHTVGRMLGSNGSSRTRPSTPKSGVAAQPGEQHQQRLIRPLLRTLHVQQERDAGAQPARAGVFAGQEAVVDELHTLIQGDIFDTDGSSPEQLKKGLEKAGESMNERGGWERLIDQVNSTGVIGGSRDEHAGKGRRARRPPGED